MVCGLYLGRKNSEIMFINARLESTAVWKTLEFGLNGLVFILMGLQLRLILSGIHDLSMGSWRDMGHVRDPGYGVENHLGISRRGDRLLDTTQPDAPKRSQSHGQTSLYRGLDGMRGVLALAAAISLPTMLQNGAPFPQRNFIIFLTFCVIFVTLVLQGSLCRR